ncbi:hypothetical protein [Paludisphaera sp.]|uniref:hypothetical protein n=1 Tax=Paludisphaera sp. TaxID=2017432 RepID=UPI00301E0D71
MDEAALRAWLAEPRTELTAAVAEGARGHVASLRARGLDIRGYAVNPGEYYDLGGLVAIADVPAPGGDPASRYHRYRVDEWGHWEEGAFPAADAIISSLNERFRSLHSRPEGVFAMDEFEVAHADALLDAIVSGLAAARDAAALGDPAPFLAVWISDFGVDGIIEDSVQRLNPPHVADDFMEEFG